MSDLKKYIAIRKKTNAEFAKGFDQGYQTLKFGSMLKTARKESAITQEALTEILHTQKSAISRIENHSDDVKLLTLERFASALGKKVEIRLV
jgi:DNA-binding XRE family transcriptional regulator